jgi:hypothetical protein
MLDMQIRFGMGPDTMTKYPRQNGPNPTQQHPFGAQMRDSNGNVIDNAAFNTATGRNIGSPRNVRFPISPTPELRAPDENAQVDLQQVEAQRARSMYHTFKTGNAQSVAQGANGNAPGAPPPATRPTGLTGIHAPLTKIEQENMANGWNSDGTMPEDIKKPKYIPRLGNGSGSDERPPTNVDSHDAVPAVGTNPGYIQPGPGQEGFYNPNRPGTPGFNGPNLWTGPSLAQKLAPGDPEKVALRANPMLPSVPPDRQARNRQPAPITPDEQMARDGDARRVAAGAGTGEDVLTRYGPAKSDTYYRQQMAVRQQIADKYPVLQDSNSDENKALAAIYNDRMKAYPNQDPEALLSGLADQIMNPNGAQSGLPAAAQPASPPASTPAPSAPPAGGSRKQDAMDTGNNPSQSTPFSKSWSTESALAGNAQNARNDALAASEAVAQRYADIAAKATSNDAYLEAMKRVNQERESQRAINAGVTPVTSALPGAVPSAMITVPADDRKYPSPIYPPGTGTPFDAPSANSPGAQAHPMAQQMRGENTYDPQAIPSGGLDETNQAAVGFAVQGSHGTISPQDAADHLVDASMGEVDTSPPAVQSGEALRQALRPQTGAGSLSARTAAGQADRSSLTNDSDWAHMFQPRMPVDWAKLSSDTGSQISGPNSSGASGSGADAWGGSGVNIAMGSGNPDEDEQRRRAAPGMPTGASTAAGGDSTTQSPATQFQYTT